ncbi:ThuA domain-containing protein [Akkermansiaceae bacterium]|nr:ThuA domain-containing protein [Akkermansiaceae bacterium]
MKRLLIGASLWPTLAFALPLNTDVISIHDLTEAAPATEVLFFGYQENTHHSPSGLHSVLTAPLNAGGISMTFTTSLNDLSDATLANYDAVMMYGNARSFGDSTSAPQVPALVRYVESGGGLAGLHVASAAFRNNLVYGALLGGRFDFHGAGQFVPVDILPNHSLLQGAVAIDSFDETYRLKDLNPDIIVLQEYVNGGTTISPWSWVRTQGKGRVFYTASGHLPGNQSTDPYDTTTKPAFYDLVLRGVRWASKRHFSAVGAVALDESGKLAASGDFLADDQALVWQGDLAGPDIFATAGDVIEIDGVSYEFSSDSSGEIIPCPSGELIFFRSVIDESSITREGIWRKNASGLLEAIAVEGRALSAGQPDPITGLAGIVGDDFVANGAGEVLFRARTTGSHLVLASKGAIASEGQGSPALPAGVTFGNLDNGALSLNRAGQLGFFAQLAGSATAGSDEAVFYQGSGGLALVAREGDAVPGLAGLTWGSFGKIRLNGDGKMTFAASFAGGSVTDDSAVMIYDPASGNTTVSLRENETAGAGEIDDLFASDFVLGNSGEVVLMAPLRGPAITSGNDVALIRAGVTLLVEGGNLPTISSTATMGATFGASPVSISPNGRIAFLADFLEGAVSKKALFQIEEGVVFELAREGEALADGPGAAYQISSISSLLSAGPDDGYPSSLGAQDDIAVSFETGGSQSLTSRLYGLDDLDGDGLSNLIEAAIGGDAQNSADHLTQLPSLQELSGQRHYVFHQPTVAGLPAVVFEESADLESWSTVMGSATPTADQSGVPTGYERVSYPVSSSAVKRFLRVGVQSSAP